MKKLIEFLISHDSLLFNLTVVSSTVAFTFLLYLPKLLSTLNKIDIKLTDIEKMHEFFISKLINSVFITIEDLVILKDSLSESSIIIKKLIEQNIVSGKYNVRYNSQQINNTLHNNPDKYPVNPKYFK